MEILDLSSETFKDLMMNLNVNVWNVLKRVHDGDFESGEVTLKLNISMVSKKEYEDSEEYYKSPNFDYKISRTLKQSETISSAVAKNLKLVIEDDKFMLQKPLKPQVDLDEYKTYLDDDNVIPF